MGVKVEFSEATGFCGIHPGARLDDPNIAWFWAELERQGMMLVIDLGAIGSASYQTAAVRMIATTHPGLTITIAHLGQPTPAAEFDANAWRLWEEQIELGLLPNVFFDTASLPAYVAEEGYPFLRAGHYIREAIRRLGSSKVMWGTDIPGLLSVAMYNQLLHSAQEQLRFLSDAERAQVFGENALRIFRRRVDIVR